MDEIKLLLEYWQKALRLQDWDIDMDVMRLKDWVAAGRSQYTVGVCSETRTNGWAKIRLLHLDDIPGDVTPGGRDVEVTLVHELLHLVMPVRDDAGTDVEGERAINRVAEALVRLRRAAA